MASHISAEHVFRRNHDCTFRPKYFLVTSLTQTPMTIFISSPKIRMTFFVFFPTFPQLSTIELLISSNFFSISSLKNSVSPIFLVVDSKYGYFSHFSTFPPRQPLFITAKTAFHHGTFSFITAHFVHHCS